MRFIVLFHFIFILFAKRILTEAEIYMYRYLVEMNLRQKRLNGYNISVINYNSNFDYQARQILNGSGLS